MPDALTEAQVWDQEVIARETGVPVAEAADPAAAEPITPVAEEPDPTADFKEQIAALNHQLSSSQGRLFALQKEHNETVQAAAAAATQVREAPTASEVQQAIANPEQWDALKGDFPEWANATEALLDAREKRFLASMPQQTPAQLQALIDERVKGETGALRQEVIVTTLEGIYPGWVEETKLPDGSYRPEFGQWLASQSPETQQLAQSDRIGDAARMLSLWTQRNTRSPIQDKRTQTLEAAAAAPGRGSGKPPQSKSPDEMSAEELWAYEKAQRAKRHT